MPVETIERVPLPDDSRIARLPFHDYVDAYRVRVDPELVPDVDAAARAFAQAPPPWIQSLMAARDAVVGVFGLKRVADAARANDGVARLGIFPILERDDREIIAGEDDRHLDFRISIFYERDTEGSSVVVTTAVRFHNALGRAYFLPVAPVHRRIVPAMLRRLIHVSAAEADTGA